MLFCFGFLFRKEAKKCFYLYNVLCRYQYSQLADILLYFFIPINGERRSVMEK